jgi:PAS domain S-box-containing protein
MSGAETFDWGPVLCGRVTPDGRVLAGTPALAALFDVPVAALPGRRLVELAEAGGGFPRLARVLGTLGPDRPSAACMEPWHVEGRLRREIAFSLTYSEAPGGEPTVQVVGVALESGTPADSRVLAAFVENSNDFIGIADPDGRPTWLNPAGRRLVGFEPDFPVSETQIPEYYAEAERPRVLDTILPAMLRDGRWKGETVFRNFATGESIPVSDEHFTITDHDTGEVLGFGTITRDISELRRAREAAESANRQLRTANEEIGRLLEKAQELDRAKSRFFSNVSHEFRTPLTLILGPVEDLLAAPGLPDAAKQALERVHRNALRLLRLVNDLLDLSRLEAGRMVARLEPTDLGRFTAEVASAFESAFADAGLAFEVDCPPSPRPVPVDRDKWEKVVLNLLSNALKFTLTGRVRIALAEEADGLRLSVSDTGVGIPEGEREQVFERFYRAQGPAARSHEGTGIGLALCREFVLLHGGTITALGAPGGGTEIRVRLPVRRTAEPSTEALAHAARAGDAAAAACLLPVVSAVDEMPVPPTDPTAPVVLVVDDSADMRAHLSDLLAPLYQVRTAPDGGTALEICRTFRPDLVLCDVMMPGLDGWAVTRALRADERTRTLPVILLSARAGPEAATAGLEQGADDYIAKPFTRAELLARVRSHIVMARARNELLEELHRANRELETFGACASHDLRAPVRRTRGFAELLIRRYGEALGPDGRKQVEFILQAADDMTLLIDDVLALSRATNAPLARRPVDVGALARRLVGHLRAEQPARVVTVEIAPDLSVGADPGLLTLLLDNLLRNAWKFTAPRGEDARIEIGATQLDGRPAIFVSDNGVGFDPALAPRLFNPFERLHARSDFEGTGLGLATVRRIAARHGGVVTGTGAPDGGARFVFALDPPTD